MAKTKASKKSGMILPGGWSVQIRNGQNLLLVDWNIEGMSVEDAANLITRDVRIILGEAIMTARRLKIDED